MNKLRRFVIGALFISSVVTLSVIPGFAFAFAPNSPVIAPFGITTNGSISFTADSGAFVTGYTTDGTDPEVSCIAQQCNAVGTTQIFSGQYGSTWIFGVDGDPLTVRAASFDDEGQGSPVMVKDYIFDKEAPVVSGFTDGTAYNHPVTINISDASWIEATVNGQYYTSNTITVAQDGNYELYVNDAFMQFAPVYHFTIDQTAPTLALNGGDDITVEARAPFNDPGITTNDASGIVKTWTEGDLNTGIVGTYTVKYYAEDALGNVSSITRTIHVVDTTAPVITLNGSNNVILEVHSSYIEFGATALDSYDGNLTPNIVISGSVDVHHVGVYTITYTVTDANGNISTVTRTVRVVDTTAPVLTLNGNTNITLEVHSPYVEAGYTAVDNYDGDITSGVVVSGAVNVNIVGTYVLTYTITDANGNVTVLTRTIHVVDTTAPVITLNGSSAITLEVHSSYTELGAVATDNYDGDITSMIVVTGFVDVHTVGVYTLTYTITDANGNVSVITRTVRVVDTTKPVITLIGNNDVTLEVFSSYLELGATAVDNYDGVVSVQILGVVNSSVLGDYTVTYVATDANGNTAFITRVIHVVDTTPPAITLIGLSDITIEVHSSYVEPGYIAIDNYDGNITALVLVNNPVNIHVIGVYLVTYNVIDASGNVAGQLTRTVRVVDTTDPLITIIGQNPVVIEAGTSYTDAGATATDNYDGDITSSIIISSNVNTGIVGVYYVTYTVTDVNGNTATVTRTVRVVDTTRPVVILNGNSSITLEVGLAYTELGASAWDSYDGIISVTVSGSVNTNVVGVYVITYTAVDSHGNTTVVTRTIHVVDTTAPVITLNGSNNVTLEVHSGYVEFGATALDSYDGNLTPNIVILGSVDVHHVGVYTITYTVTDVNGNTATVTRTVRVVDTTAPVLTLNGNTNITLEVHSPYVEAGYTAVDNYDGDITSGVVVSGAVNVNIVGTYVLTYTITDANGNVTVLTRTIHVVDTTAPVITLNGSSAITLEVHSSYTELGAVATDNYDGDITSMIVVTGFVDVHTVGVYTLTYTITDANGNVSVITRTVRVVDTTKPVITLIGNGGLILTVGDNYNEFGAIAIDNYDGDISGKIVINGFVDIANAGVYTLIYTITDANGNTSSVVRTVTVFAKPVVNQISTASTDQVGGEDLSTDVSSATTDSDELGNVEGTITKASDGDSDDQGQKKFSRFVWSNLDTILSLLALIIFLILSYNYYKNKYKK